MKHISFFIPAYNCAKTITETVESIMRTNFREGDELVIVDDYSTDDTAIVLRSLQTIYPGTVVITHRRNKGGAAARNTAVENAQHELVFCLDSDNVLEDHSIAPLHAFLLEQKADIACFHELKYFNGNIANVEESWYHEPGTFTIENLLSGKLSPGGSGNYLFLKSSWLKVNGYSEDLGALDTWAFGFKQLIENCKMVVMPTGYYFHRRGHESYYIRDAWTKRRSVSLRLIKLIINYIDLIHPDDVNYIFSRKGRYVWFDNLNKRPIRLNGGHGDNPIWDGLAGRKKRWQVLKEKAIFYKIRIGQKVFGSV